MTTRIEIEDVQRLDVKPGDVLLVTLPRDTGAQDCERIKAAFETLLPIRAIVKSSDVAVQIVGEMRIR